MTVAEYMELRCLCGLTRAEHMHAMRGQRFCIVGGMSCDTFTWEMEAELGGNPLLNKHLRPLMDKNYPEWAEEPGHEPDHEPS